MITPEELRDKIVAWLNDVDCNLSSALDIAAETNASILVVEGNEKLTAFVHIDRDDLLRRALKEEKIPEILAMIDAIDAEPENDRILIMYFNEETTAFGNVFMKKWPIPPDSLMN